MLTPEQYKAIELFFVRNSIQEIADEIKVTEGAVRYWLKNKEFCDFLEESRHEFEQVFKSRLLSIALESLKNLEKFVKDVADRRTVIKTIEVFLKSKALNDAEEINNRLKELERIAGLRNVVENTENREIRKDIH